MDLEMGTYSRTPSGQALQRARPGLVTLRSLLVLMLLAFSAPATVAAATVAPLPRSDYAVRPACSAPAPGRASCLALGLTPRTAAARARVHPLASRSAPRTGLAEASECAEDYPSSCLSPHDLQSAYFPGEKPEAPVGQPQTIALVDAYNDPSAEADLNAYAAEYGLPACTRANGCFKQMSEDGGEASFNLPFPRSKSELEAFSKGTSHQQEEAEEAEGWALEIATDIEIAHAACQNCHILLVEASSPEYPELETAENTAALHANEISDSWGGPEGGSDDPAFDHPGLAITAASGDNGYLNWDQYATRAEAGSPYFQGADYPASSPHVISVGGTALTLDGEGAWQSESAWNSQGAGLQGAGGSGCSGSLQAPAWQQKIEDWTQVGCGTRRANADVAADADPSTGVNVYDTIPYSYEEGGKKFTTVLHWAPIGGTSVASPIIASMIALAGGAHGVAYPAQTLYSHLGSSLLHDVIGGGNGRCDAEYFSCEGSMSPLSPLDCGESAWICNATTGYDGPTGVGTPNGIGAFQPEEAPAKGSEEGEHKSKPSEEQGQPGAGSSEGAKGGQGAGSSGSGTGTQQPSGLGASAGSAGSSTGGPGSASPSAGQTLPRISDLKLTAYAQSALRHGRIALAQVGFSFSLNQATTVHARLAVRVGHGSHRRWQTLPASLTFAAIRGVNRRHLHRSGRLAPGVYRLTIAVANRPNRVYSRGISFSL
jgi:hypothetical protein